MKHSTKQKLLIFNENLEKLNNLLYLSSKIIYIYASMQSVKGNFVRLLLYNNNKNLIDITEYVSVILNLKIRPSGINTDICNITEIAKELGKLTKYQLEILSVI